jgi:predicted transcriptional regulator
MSSPTPTRNRDVMNNHYAMIDGMHTVAEAIQVAISKNVSILVVNKRNEHDEYGMVLMSDIERKVLAKDKSPERTNIHDKASAFIVC